MSDMDLSAVQNIMWSRGLEQSVTALESERKTLSRFLHENAKGVLIKSRISSIRDIDAPTSFHFEKRPELTP